MKPIFEALERHGLIQDQDALNIEELDSKKVTAIYEDVHKTVFENQYQPSEAAADLDPFNYVASASLRGDATCWEFGCRLKKIDFLNSFAALYATQVTVPLLLKKPDTVLEDPAYAARLLSRSVLTLLRSRPLIEAGIMRPAVMLTAHCEHDIELTRGLAAAAQEFAIGLAKDLAPEFQAVFQIPEKSPTGEPSVYVSGPEDFLEHDLVILLNEPPGWRLKSWRYDPEGKVILRGSRKLAMIFEIFRSIASNTSFYLTYGLDLHARLLSDLPGETIMLEDMSLDEKLIEDTKGLRELTHILPLLTDLSIPTVLRLRNEDRESFAAYRYEIASITAEALHNGISEEAARDSLRARVLPRINKIKQELQAERSKKIGYLGVGAAALAASVGLGACGLPLLATVPAAAAAAAVGARLLGKGSEAAVESRLEVKQRNELYFLVKLLKEAE
jgi:hypothetical protein